MKSLLRKLFYTSRIARYIIGGISILSGRTARLGVFHIATYNDKNAIGPLQQPEALLLFALVRTIVPTTILEFGFYHGHSAFNFLKAMAPDAHLYSFDFAPESAHIAKTDFPKDARFHFLYKSQAEFCHADVENRTIDLVFFDASHDFRLNQQTFELVLQWLSKDAIICIHDTGVWHKDHFSSIHSEFAKQKNNKDWLTESTYAHQNDERIFVNWIAHEYPHFQCIHAHSVRALRHGISILQQTRILETAGTHAEN